MANFTPRPHNPRQKKHSTHETEGWVGPRAGPDVLENKKSLSPPGIQSGPSSPFPSLYIVYAISQSDSTITHVFRPTGTRWVFKTSSSVFGILQ